METPNSDTVGDTPEWHSGTASSTTSPPPSLLPTSTPTASSVANLDTCANAFTAAGPRTLIASCGRPGQLAGLH